MVERQLGMKPRRRTENTAGAFEYTGNELELFSKAFTWKRYVRSKLIPFIRGDVLEVGAGIGETSRYLCDVPHRSWLCLEPDPRLANQLSATLEKVCVSPRPSVEIGTIDDLPRDVRFDTVLYIDVLEHIERDAKELERASERLVPGGRLVVLSPAFEILMSEFDRSLGHWRRYTRASLAAAFPKSLRRLRLDYLDSMGFLASLANRFVLRQRLPSSRQIALWDRVLVPVSRVTDAVLSGFFGRSVLAVYERS